MAKDLHKDDFEDFFKDTFEGQSEDTGEGDWDVPSDKVWENIDKVINPEEEDPKGVFLWWTGMKKWLALGGVLLLSFMALIVFKYSQKEDLADVKSERIILENANENYDGLSKEKINNESLKDNIKEKKVMKFSDESSNINIENDLSEMTELNQDEILSIGRDEEIGGNKKNQNELDQLKATKNILAKPKSIKPEKNKEEVSIPNEFPAIEKDSTTVRKEIALQKEPTLKTDIESDLNSSNKDLNLQNKEKIFVSLDPIPMKTVFVESQNKEIDTLTKTTAFTGFNDPVDFPGRKSRGFYTGLMFAPMNNYRDVQTKNRIAAAIDQFRDEKASITFSAGLNLGYKLSENWSFETGFNYAKMSIELNRRKQLRYSAVGEQINDSGEFEKNYSLDLITSGGSVDTDIAVARSSSTSIPENDFINLKLRTQSNISFVNIPLIARYQFGEGKVQMGLKAGLVNRFVTKGELQVESVETLRSGIRLVLNDRFYEPRTLRNLNSYEADFLFGAGVYYHLNDKIWLSIEPTISRSLNPIFENQNFKTFPVFRSLDLGVNYLF